MIYIDLNESNGLAEACDERDNGNGTFSYQQVSNGMWLCVTPDGVIEQRSSPGGLWESFLRASNALVAERDKDGVKVAYLLPYAEVK